MSYCTRAGSNGSTENPSPLKFRPTSPVYGTPGQELQRKGLDEHEVAATEKVAIKCDRVNPCHQCVKTTARCTYTFGRKAREKRQRVLISSVYERRLEDISIKIDQLGEVVKRLADERPGTPCLRNPVNLNVSLHSSLQSSSTQTHIQPPSQARAIEPSLFAQVMVITGALQATVSDIPYGNVSTEMTAALDALWMTVSVQKQQNETLAGSRPFRNELSSGLSLRDLPIPPLEKIMACLRIAQESPPSQLYWPFEFGSLAEFTQYVIKACSPGPITDMELIIVHYVLSWLFTECSNSAGDEDVRRDYEMQALTCRGCLETIISNLSFHIDTHTDSIRAMYMAALYCLYCGKVSTAWTCITRASLMSQALGLHSSHIMAAEPTEGVQGKVRLFWAIYVLEKSLSLRLGRSSTIRDQDITVPRLLMDCKMTSLVYNRMPDWIDVANLHGRVYDNLYSPNALEQPFSDRVSCANALASELEQKRPNQWTSHGIHAGLSKFIIHATRAIDYSTLASIYRGTSSEKPFSMASCPECITAARAALEDSEACISMIADMPSWPPSYDVWVNEILLLAPFMPFLILLGNVVESSDLSDLGRLQRLIHGLHSLTRSPRYSSCIRQLRIFKALYDVVAIYVQNKATSSLVDLIGGDQYTELGIDKYIFDPDVDGYSV
ncbi:hypothetical protein BDV38DRAFT_268035 [Aspergillus pseudotamarii]|uniref:Xylanolytic transcriptional activator regulatory domain-containing protein n=1 Tax=Aspergillus pseudotamarii TaxID=132259 RepID=A0A5N6T7M0_ASPPS|nr:uncharacterized protein BDV38DRAFT_268035 [Aspergillus pseudotamarii]KAE8142333.1 hypothetical protein BDV38DRAFT_268035 [Aspergillus pseudotamarii]